MNAGENLTQLINDARAGDHRASERALELIYARLKAMASNIQRQHAHTLSPTALVHESYLRLFQGVQPPLNDRQHFFRLAARAMRQILVDRARERASLKRGGDLVRAEMPEQLSQDGASEEDILAIDQALAALARRDPELAELTEQRYFAGLSFEEIADYRGVSERSVRRDWETARAFLLKIMGEAGR
ncbi:MAG: ECF-type sigma factor [Lysobacterales bacterium]